MFVSGEGGVDRTQYLFGSWQLTPYPIGRILKKLAFDRCSLFLWCTVHVVSGRGWNVSLAGIAKKGSLLCPNIIGLSYA